jgi:hypothetical protein
VLDSEAIHIRRLTEKISVRSSTKKWLTLLYRRRSDEAFSDRETGEDHGASAKLLHGKAPEVDWDGIRPFVTAWPFGLCAQQSILPVVGFLAGGLEQINDE